MGFVQDTAEITINFPSTGNVVLREVEELSIDDEAELEPVNLVNADNPDRPSAVRAKPGAIMITLTEVPKNPPQVDWYGIKDGREEGAVTIQYRGGRRDGLRVQFTPAYVSKVADAGVNAEGESTREITVMALARREQ